MFLHVVNAKYLAKYQVEVGFNNGREGVADLAEALKGPVFAILKDESKFAEFSVDDELKTIVWSNGADLAPEYVYFQAFKDDPSLQSQFKNWGYIS